MEGGETYMPDERKGLEVDEEEENDRDSQQPGGHHHANLVVGMMLQVEGLWASIRWEQHSFYAFRAVPVGRC